MLTTLVEALVRAAAEPSVELRFQKRPGRVSRHTYADVLERARRVAGGLRRAGLEPGDRVALVLPTGIEFYDAFFGAMLAGLVPAALYPPVRLGRLEGWKVRTEAMLRRMKAKAVITDGRLLGLVGHPVSAAALPFGALRIDTLVGRRPIEAIAEPSPDDLACVQFSSGTTGKPKPVALSHRNIVANAQAIMSTFPGDPRHHSGVSWLPLYHDMGLVGALGVALLTPGTLTLLPPERFVARPRLWLEALSESGATISVAPNFAFGLCVDRIDDLDGLDLSRWKVALCGAEPVHPSTLDRFVERFAAVGFPETALTPVYGLAEATLAVSFSALDRRFQCCDGDRESIEMSRCFSPGGPDRLVRLGPALPGTSIEIRRDGQAQAEGVVGRVWVRGPGVMMGYLDDPKATAEAIVDGWLDTGDEGFFWRGELVLTGRQKDLIILRGRNHDPSAIEFAIDGIEGLRRGCAAAFAVPVEEGEGVALLAEARGPVDEATLMAMREALRGKLGLDPAVLEVLPAGTLPRTSSGKIRRQETRRLWLAEALSAPDEPGVVRLLAEAFRGRQKLRRQRP